MTNRFFVESRSRGPEISGKCDGQRVLRGLDLFLVMAWLTTSLWMSLQNQYLCNGVDLCDGVDWIPHSNTVLGLQDCSWTCVEHSWTDHNTVHFSLTGLLSFTAVKWVNFQLRGTVILIQVMNRGKECL